MTLEDRAIMHERMAADAVEETQRQLPRHVDIDPDSDNLGAIHRTLALICRELARQASCQGR